MRSLVPAFLVLAACRIPDGQFIAITDDAGGGDDASDAMGDAAQATLLTKAWLVDQNSKLYFIRKATDGALTLTSMITTTNSPTSAVTNKQGTHLFVANINAAAGNSVTDFLINPDGQLSNPSVKLLAVGSTDCTPSSMTVHPTGNYLAVGCANSRIAILNLDANGSLTASSTVTHANFGQAPENLVFTPDGACLFALDRQSGNMTLHRLSFNSALGVAALMGTSPSTASKGVAIHPNGQHLYVAGDSSVQMHQISPGCGLSMVDSEGIAGMATGNTSIVVAPDGHRLFVSTTGIYVYNLGPDGTMNAVSPSPMVNSIMIEASTMDPALPDVLYVTSRADGVIPVSIATNTLTAGAAIRPTGSGTNFIDFAMAP